MDFLLLYYKMAAAAVGDPCLSASVNAFLGQPFSVYNMAWAFSEILFQMCLSENVTEKFSTSFQQTHF